MIRRTNFAGDRFLDELLAERPPTRPVGRSARRAGLSPPPLEKIEQASILKVLAAIGAQVWTTGTRRPRGESQSTRMTPGLPDLIAFLPARGDQAPRLVCIEVKRTGRTMSPDQQRFRGCCEAASVAHVAGDAATVVEWLEAAGYLRTAAR